jgi:hypothetical protein
MAERSPKRRNFEEDGAELDSILNPARNYPRKRVAVAVSVVLMRKEGGTMLNRIMDSAKYVGSEKPNVVSSGYI